MTKSAQKTVYCCTECDWQSPKWSGQCMGCRKWNTLQEQKVAADVSSTERFAGIGPSAQVLNLDDVEISELERIPSFSDEFDRVLGGGLVPGSVVLIGGDPGIGKSTLLLQQLSKINEHVDTLYVTGEESAEQLAMRSKRLGLNTEKLRVMPENQLENLLEAAQKEKPRILVIDSIQTIFTEVLPAAPGSVSQVRESAARLVRYAKQYACCVILVGHVTKEGAIAGPRILEHMVDCVLYFEGDSSNSFRMIRAIKNRFGAVNEVGVFAMTEQGLRDVSNPSAMFVSRHGADRPGSVVLATHEGTRPLLVEIQALVDDSPLANPRRLCVGLEHNRIAMLLAIAHRYAGISLNSYDVFTNVTGGIRISETGSDLAVLMAILSSVKNQAIGSDTVVFGEIGLSGELRPVQRGLERLREAEKMGFTRALLPAGNRPRSGFPNMKISAHSKVEKVLEFIDF